MADLIELWLADQEVYQRAAIESKLAEVRKVPEGFDGESCVVCEDPIEPARLKLGMYHCLECARRIEVNRRTHG